MIVSKFRKKYVVLLCSMICVTFFAPIAVMITELMKGEKVTMSLFFGLGVLITILIYITTLSTQYLNKVTMTDRTIESKDIWGRLKKFDCDKENVEISIGTMTNKLTNREEAITITSGKKKIIVLEAYYENYTLLKSEIIALEKK